ncbi:hypothetical protein Syun_003806 [Stephania yunnanensis]|uniref:Uncharacterized protein n=1 Tax=Stephania yunnanensis TaxID=152371 RepID=A0AAP0L4G3_9MAGN
MIVCGHMGMKHMILPFPARHKRDVILIKQGEMKHEFIPKASTIEDRVIGVANLLEQEIQRVRPWGWLGKHATMSKLMRARKIVIHCGRNRHATNSQRFKASKCHKEQDLTTSNGKLSSKVLKLSKPNPDDLGYADSVSVEEVGAGEMKHEFIPEASAIEDRVCWSCQLLEQENLVVQTLGMALENMLPCQKLLMVLKISSKFELRHFCRTTGSVAMLKLRKPNPDDLGYADSVSVEEVGAIRILVILILLSFIAFLQT